MRSKYFFWEKFIFAIVTFNRVQFSTKAIKFLVFFLLILLLLECCSFVFSSSRSAIVHATIHAIWGNRNNIRIETMMCLLINVIGVSKKYLFSINSIMSHNGILIVFKKKMLLIGRLKLHNSSVVSGEKKSKNIYAKFEQKIFDQQWWLIINK